MPLCWWGESLDGGRFEAISKIPPRDFLLGWSCPAHRFPPALLHLMIANYADYMGPDCANTQRDACRVAMLLANCHFSCSPNQWAEWTWLKGLSPPSPPACAPRTSHGIGITVIANAFLAPSAKLHTFNWKTQSSEGSCQKKTVFFGRSLPNVGGWGGWLPNKVQTPQNPPKLPRKSPFSTRISPFVLPNLTKTQGWVGG